MNDGAVESVTEIYADDGAVLSGSSEAVHYKAPYHIMMFYKSTQHNGRTSLRLKHCTVSQMCVQHMKPLKLFCAAVVCKTECDLLCVIQ